jgi:hypothetical protein
VIGGAGRGGWARRGASCQPASRAERPCARAVRLHAEAAGPHARPRAGAPSPLRAPGGYMESVRLVPLIDLCRFALLPGLCARWLARSRCLLPGASQGKAGAPEGSQLESLNNNNHHDRCLPTWVGVALWKWRRRGCGGW